jgi:excinuclease UvrABC nuclease subunit
MDKDQVRLDDLVAFTRDAPPDYFVQFPNAPAVFLLRGEDPSAEPYVSKTANLRRRLLRLLAPPESQSKRLNLRERVASIEYTLTGSDFESGLLLYKTLRREFPRSYQKRLRLRPAALIKLNLENEYPRAYVTTRLGRLGGKSIYYGPFRSRIVAEKFMNDSLDLFKMRRCTFDLNPDPKFPGCVYSEMKMCLAPCFKGCTDQEYALEVSRVQAYFDSGGQSLLQELEAERDRLSSTLDFESASQQHTRITKVKGILGTIDELSRRVEQIDAVIVQPSNVSGSVSLFRLQHGEVAGPHPFPLPEENSGSSIEDRVREVLAEFGASGAHSAVQFAEELALVKRWYYRTHKVGEILLADEAGAHSVRKIANAIRRVAGKDKDVAASSPAPSE